MSSEEFKNLPYALRLAKMGRQKVSRGEHNKRTEEIKTLINKTPKKTPLLQTPPSLSKKPLLPTPSGSSSKKAPLQTPSCSSPKTPKQQPLFKKRITTVHTHPPPVWKRDYRHEDPINNFVRPEEDKENFTRISINSSHKSSSHP